MNNLIIVKQLPEIEEHLQLIKTDIEIQVNDALTLECTAETVKTVKAIRAYLNKKYQELEDKRKEVKNAILAPYQQFETIYKECVTNLFKPADQQLACKITDVENGLKEQKSIEIFEYFEELCIAKNIDFVKFVDTGAVVTLSASKKSLKDRVKAFLDKVSDDLAMINTQEYAAEILAEYKQSLNVSQSITHVVERHKAIEVEKLKSEHSKQFKQTEDAAVKEIETFAPPVVEEPTYTIAFKVTAAKSKLQELKQFLNSGGYQYE